ncbi:MAG: GNAT family N-acetyltransferase [Hoeflea sp.]|uniref:GNAT family N-acetyltransferase n=1 Tax=Hoeflea sp. TaxID=1940281 RepID=UPI0032EFAB00
MLACANTNQTSIAIMVNAHDISANPVFGAAVAPRRPRVTAYLSTDLAAANRNWAQLEQNPDVSFHQSRAWVGAWAGGTGMPVSVITLDQDGQTLAVLPLEMKKAAGLRIARFAGTAFSNANTGLVADVSLPENAISPFDLKEALARAGLNADIILFDKMPPEAATRAPFAQLPRVLHQNPSFQLPLFENFQDVLAQINGKRRRKKFRLSERRLEAIGGYRHITGDDDEQSMRLLETFLKQKPTRLAAQGLPNVFADPGVRSFLARLAMTRSASGEAALELHGIELAGGEHEGTIIAVAGLTRKQGHVTCQFGSIDETIAADASAGELLFYRMIERAAKAGEKVFDFGVGDQLYKRSWCPVRTDLVDCYLPLTLKGRVAAPMIAVAISAKRVIKSSPALKKSAAFLRGLTVRESAGSSPHSD